MRIANVTGVVLVGGRSRRFGSNKSFAKVDGEPLIDRVTGLMRSLFERVVLITNTPELYGHLCLPMFEDRIKGLGPIGGIYTALMEIPSDYIFVTACDMPYLSGPLIRHLVSVKGDFDATVPVPGKYPEPLHALYSKRCLPAVKRSIDDLKYKIADFYNESRIQFIPEAELRELDPELKSFYNINRPQDVKGGEND